MISDGKPGHINQARALCGLMAWSSQETIVTYPFAPAKGATYLLDWLGVRTAAPFVLTSPEGADFEADLRHYAVVVAVGSAAYYPAKVIAKKAALPVVALMYPRGFKADFDRILCPAYDNPPSAPHIIPLPITLCAREEGYYEAMTADFAKAFAYRLPGVGVIIGGDNAYAHLCPDRLAEQLEQLFALTPEHQHWVTTSRRTSAAVEAVVERFDFDYALIYSKRRYNPIPAFLMLSDYLFVTSDSSSMLSECVCTGKAKVEVLKNITQKKSKFDTFLTDLAQHGCVHLFDGHLGQADRKIDIGQTVRSALADVACEREVV